MTTGRAVDVENIYERGLQLFVNGHNAWQHLREHVLGEKNGGEERGWVLLIPALRTELAAAEVEELRALAQASSYESSPSRLRPIYLQFLDCIQQSIEGAAKRCWYWEQTPGAEGRWATFGREGVLAYLDDHCVRTAFLPEKNSGAWSDPTVGTPRYRLFLACLERLRHRYQRAIRSNRIEAIQPALDDLLQQGLDDASWRALL
jgi:hypothetical protein